MRFHRGKDPRPVYPPFAALEPAVQRSCIVLTGLLRIAHAIGRGPEDDRLELEIDLQRERLGIRIAGSGNPDAAVAEARLASGLLRRTFGIEIEVVVGIPSGTSA